MISIKPDGYELIPVAMTSDTAPSPLVASASSTTGSYSAYKAFNGTTVDSSDAWITAKVADNTEVWLQLNFGVQTKVSCYSITPRNASGGATGRYLPVKWDFQGSDDGLLFTTLDSQDNILDWGDFTKESFFQLPKSVSYRYYRITIYRGTDVAGTGISLTAIERGIGELKFYVNTAKEETQKSISKDNMQQILNTVYSDLKNVQDSRVEISNPLTTTDISQESPIGSIISFSGSKIPEHYLVCDGSIYNIVDYPKLAEHFKNQFGFYNVYGGDGITTFAVPKREVNVQYKGLIPIMTSNTSPSGTATGNSLMSGYDYYQSFDDNLDTAWTSKATACYLEYDFNIATTIGAYSVQTRNFVSQTNANDITTAPKNWTFEGSNDGSVWDVLDTQSNIIWTTRGEQKTFVLGNKRTYLKYRINITANNGFNGATSIGRLQFYFGELSFFDCIKYEPTYYAVNQYGGFESEVLFDGLASSGGDYVLKEDVSFYDYLIVKFVNIKKEETIINNITPIMTSNITPAPYVVSASSSYDTSTYQPWKAFDASVGSAWATQNNIINGHITLDFSKDTVINAFSITCRTMGGDNISVPKNFTLQGSKDGSYFEDIKSITNETGWVPGGTKSYNLENNVSYRYYRINIAENNGQSLYSAIGELRFYNNIKPKEDIYSYNCVIGKDDAANGNYFVISSATINDSNILKAKIHFSSNNTLTIDTINTTFNESYISEIIGIKGQLPTLIQGGTF